MLLAVDTATPRVSVAVARGSAVVAVSSSTDGMRHAETLIPLVTRALQDVGATPRDVSEVAVGVGPGPFTGLRVGLMSAKALAEAVGATIAGVCSLDVIATEVVGTGLATGPFVVATDARRRELYWAQYDVGGSRAGEPRVSAPAAVPRLAGGAAGAGAAAHTDHFDQVLPVGYPDAGWMARGILAGSLRLLPPVPLYLRQADARPVATAKPVTPQT